MELDVELEMFNLEMKSAEAEAGCQTFQLTVSQLSMVLN